MFLQLSVFPHRGTQRLTSGRISLQRACAASVARASGVAWWCCGGGAWGHPPQLRHSWTVLTKRLADGSGVVGSMPWPRFMMCGRPAIFLRMSCARGSREKTWRSNRSE